MSAQVPFPSDALLGKLAPLAPVSVRPDLVAHQAPDVFELWTAWEEETGARREIPFWAVVWPAAQMTIRYLGRSPGAVRGKRVIDLGCGGGLAGIAALKAGAREVIANDIDPAALEMARRNAAANSVLLRPAGADLLAGPPPPADVILVCDLFYEKTVSERLLAWLSAAHARGVEVIIADASRPFTPTHGVATLEQERFATDWDLEGTRERTVRLLTLVP